MKFDQGVTIRMNSAMHSEGKVPFKRLGLKPAPESNTVEGDYFESAREPEAQCLRPHKGQELAP
jgi:hypothetical protein